MDSGHIYKINKLNKLILLCFFVLLGLNTINITVHAEPTTEETTEKETKQEVKKGGGNNGELRNDPFGDSGIPTSFQDCEYYDYFMPYNKTVEEVGGMAIETESSVPTYQFVPKDYGYDKHKVGGYLIQESRSSVITSYGLSWQEDPDSGLLYCEVNGAKFYHVALGRGIFSCDKVESGEFPSWYILNGIVFDCILTDGTVFHCVMGDAIGLAHSNQNGQYDGWTAPSVEEAQDHTRYKTNKLANEKYGFIYQAAGTHSTEICGDVAKALSYYNIGSDEGNNQIMYIRIYNLQIDTDEHRAQVKPIKNREGEWKTSVDKTGSADWTPDSPDTGTTTVNEDGTPVNFGVYTGTYYTEGDLSSWARLDEQNIQAKYLSGATKENLTQSELDAVAQWQDNITSHPILKAFRTLVVLLGILLTVWSVLFYICYWLQRVNNFIEIDFITLLSFGRFQLADEDTQVTYGLSKQKSEKGKTLINHKAVIKICVVTMFVGTLMITGLIYKLLVFVIHAITGKLRF